MNLLPSIAWFNTDYLLPKGKLLLDFFIILAFVGHLGVLSVLPCCFIIPLVYLFPKPKLILSVAIAVATLMGAFLIIDISVYKLYRFHLNGIIFNFIMNGLGGEILGISSKEFILTALMIAGLLLVESICGILLWRKVQRKSLFPGAFKWIFAVLGLSLYFSYSMLIYSAGYLINRWMMDMTLFLPFYTQVFGALIPLRDGQLQVEKMTEGYVIQPRKINAPLNYPSHPLRYGAAEAPKNIVVIVIDAWRFDMLNSLVTPHMNAFAKNALVFTNHSSGGNATGPGIFSLFYGLPTTYWTAMESQKKGPLLLDEVIKRHYEIGIFSSAGIAAPPFDRTVFSAVKNQVDINMLLGKNSYVRDQLVTKRFTQFIETTTSTKPFFSFLFYDSAHSYCGFDAPVQRFKPAVAICNRYDFTKKTSPLPYFNRYKNALALVDNEVDQVIQVLKAKGLLNQTVIIITGDHGEEFDDNHQGYLGHASNFTRYQVQTPLIVYWPGKSPHTFTHQTSHFDIAPTLMAQLFQCETNPKDYTLGSSLFDSSLRPYLVVGSYTSFGIVEPHQITEVLPSGGFRVEQLNAKPMSNRELNKPILQHAFLDLRRFFQKWKVEY